MSTALLVKSARVLLDRRTDSHCQFIDKRETYEPDVVSDRIIDQQRRQIRRPHLPEVDPIHLVHCVRAKLRPPIHRVQRSREEPGCPPVGSNVVPDPIHLVRVVGIRLAVPPIPCGRKDLGGDEGRVQLSGWICSPRNGQSAEDEDQGEQRREGPHDESMRAHRRLSMFYSSGHNVLCKQTQTRGEGLSTISPR